MNENEINEILYQVSNVQTEISNELIGLQSQSANMPERGRARDFLPSVQQAVERVQITAQKCDELGANLAAAREACFSSVELNHLVSSVDQYAYLLQESQHTILVVRDSYFMLDATFQLGGAVDDVHDRANITFANNSRPDHVGNIDAMRQQLTDLAMVQEYAAGLFPQVETLLATPYDESIMPQLPVYLGAMRGNLEEHYEIVCAYVSALQEEIPAP
ncbi:hypothetical protein ACIQVA_35640 [Streptomyces microflavus]|uniref:hypothetical protein n=1 Tax=Streptomyces microflavus TaxID=1919 RepID=UPI0037FD865F